MTTTRAPRSLDAGYAAFISYRHDADGPLATAVQRGLQRLAKPWHRRRALHVFRDQTSLTADPQLWPSIERALGRSAYFVLLASPGSAASPWVEREIRWWLEHKDADRILLVLTDGRLPWEPPVATSDPGADPDPPPSSALPQALRNVLIEEPRWVDLRWARGGPAPALDDPRFRDAVADLAAPMHGRAKEDLVGTEIQEHRRTRRIVRGVVAAMAVLAVLVASSATIAVTKRAEAARQRQMTLARHLAEEATQAAAVRPDLALLLAAQALATADLAESRSAMVTALRGRPRLLSVLQPPDEAAVTVPALPHALLAVRPDSRLVVAVTGREGEGAQRLVGWELPEGRKVYESDPLGEDVTALAFSPDDTRLAVGMDRELAVFHPGARERSPDDWITPVPDREIGATALAFSPDGRVLASGRADCAVEFHDARTGRKVGAWSTPGGTRAGGLNRVTSLAFSPDGRRVLRACENGTAALHEANTSRGGLAVVDDAAPGDVRLDGGSRASFEITAVAPDLSTLAVQAASGVKLWSLTGGQEIRLDEQPKGQVHSLAFSADSRTLTAGGDDVRVWHRLDLDVESWSSDDAASGLGDGVRGVAVDRTGSRLVTAGGLGSIALWDANPDQDVGGPHLEHYAASVADVSGDGRAAVTISGSTGKVWVLPSGQEVATAELSGTAAGVSLDRAGDRAAISVADRVEIWRLGEQPSKVHELNVSISGAGGAHAADLSPDGGTVAAVDTDGKVELISTTTGEVVHSMAPEDKRFFETVSFTPDGDTVAAAASGRVQLWNASSGTTMGTLDSDRDDQGLDELLLQTTPERDISFSADGNRLAVRERGGVRVWDVEEREQVGKRVDIGDLTSVALSGDGRMLLTTTLEGVVLWDPISRLPISDPLIGKGYDASPESIVASPAGGTVIGLDDDGAFVWTADTGAWTRTACHAAARALTRDEWSRYVATDQPYHPACAGQKPG